MTAKTVVASYIPVAMAEEVRKLAQESNTTPSRWIETAIKHRIILEGKWKREYEHIRGNGRGGRKGGCALVDNITEENTLDSESSDCKSNEEVVE